MEYSEEEFEDFDFLATAGWTKEDVDHYIPLIENSINRILFIQLIHFTGVVMYRKDSTQTNSSLNWAYINPNKLPKEKIFKVIEQLAANKQVLDL